MQWKYDYFPTMFYDSLPLSTFPDMGFRAASYLCHVIPEHM